MVTIATISFTGGIIGFVGGIALCFAMYPGSPQAPLFGMFFTGPAGLLLGLIASVILVVYSRRGGADDLG
jgi:hypothetical protein